MPNNRWEYMRTWRAANKDRRNADERQRRAANREVINERARARYRANPQAHGEAVARWRYRNPEKYAAAERNKTYTEEQLLINRAKTLLSRVSGLSFAELSSEVVEAKMAHLRVVGALRKADADA